MTQAAELTKRDFDRFFSTKGRELWRWAFSPNRQRNYRDPALIPRLLAEYDALEMLPPAPVPKHIFMLWQQGWNAAPPLVQACADAWRRLNPGWDLHLLDDRSLPSFAPGWETFPRPAKLHRTALSNIARLDLLKTHGGVWADATLFPTRPLDEWLPQAMGSGLFMFSKPRPYRDVEIWFIAGEAENPAIRAWHDLVSAYWINVLRPHHYYWMEYLFELLQTFDPAAGTIADSMPKLSAMGPLALPTHAFARRPPRGLSDLIARNRIPVHKLSHKWRYWGPLDELPLGVLTGIGAL